ncbi:microtubule organization protein AKNA-like isoform X1 [Conger conger]|uniref:microtubule organization protein AKNA-like isoform X1 n=2 Tax=Conger conger TaxID=82655 RepID=UPI002A5A0304|nr:microtubule organization protein AKNA-like isoform X1 [Conger conger]XP_061115315.1 microtubule organization protein AKNA-like isoform X1 [Conger conger]
MATAALRTGGAMAGDCSRAEDSGPPLSAHSGGSGACWGGRAEDFAGQMNENGIIGLDQVMEEAGLEAGGAEEDLSFHLSELQDCQSPGGDALSLCDLDEQGSDSLVSEEDGGGWLMHRLPERGRPCNMTDDEEEEEEDTNDPMEIADSFSFGAIDPRDRLQRAETPEPELAEESDFRFTGRVGGCQGNRSKEEVAAVEVSRDSLGESQEGGSLRNTLPAPSGLPLSPLHPAGGPQDVLMTPVHPHLTNSPGFQSDAFTEFQSVLETQVESCRSQWNHSLRDRISPDSQGEESQDGSDFSSVSWSSQPIRELTQDNGQAVEEYVGVEGALEGPCSSPPASPLPGTMPCITQVPLPSALQSSRKAWRSHSDCAPCLAPPKGLRTLTGESLKRGCSRDNSRYGKGQLHYPLPDFSKVEPRVLFPKEGYKPPKSKGCPRKKTPGSEKPLVFKSPADIVREVLLSSAGPPAPAGPQGPLDATVPQEFRSPRQASVLVHQLQEDYNRLLTKYAEAENTIDRLRLEAKVNLYSDPPKPSHPDYTGTLNMGSKVMTVTLPWAQRAQLSPIVVSTGTDPGKTVETGDSPTVPSSSAYTSTCSLGPQFGECLTESLSRQAGRFRMQVDSFEELLTGGRLKPFEQVLKGLSCLAQGQGSLERGYLRAREEHRLQQQQGRDPGPFDPQRELEGEIFRLGMRLEDLKEQVQPGAQLQPFSTPLTPLTHLTMGPSTASTPYPHPESQPSPPGGGARVLTGMPVCVASGEKEGEGEGGEREDETDERRPTPLPWARRHRYQHGEIDLSHPPQHVPEGTREGVLGPSPGCGQQEPLPLRPMLPRQPSQDKRWGGSRSGSGSPASAAESVAFEGPSKPQSSLRRAPPQDGIMSPETDSGFVGSQSSHLNLLAPSPPRKEALASQSSPLEGGGDQMLPINTQAHLSSAYQGITSSDRSTAVARVPEVQPSAEKSGSPRQWPNSSTSEFESESERSHSSAEDEDEIQSVCYTQPANQSPHHQRRPSLPGLHRHGNSFGVQGSDHPADRHKALQALQAEMSMLSEELEGSLRTGKSSYPITVPPLVQEVPRHSLNSSKIYPRFVRYPEDKRREEEGEQEDEGQTEEEEVEGAPYERSSPVTLRPELDIITDSQHSQPTSKPLSYDRHIPQSVGAQRRRWQRCRIGEESTEPVEHREPYTGHQNHMAASGGPDEVNQRQSHSIHAQNDINKNRTGGRAASHNTCPHSGYCARCPGSRPCRNRSNSGHSMHRTSGSTHHNVWPLGFTHRTDGGVFLTSPPPPVLGSVPLVQYVPVAPSMLYYSSPVSWTPATYAQSLDGGGRGARRHAHTADREALGDSLTRAIEAARRMRATSRRIARSLSASIQHQGALSLS